MEQENISEEAIDNKNPFLKLINGDYGLSMTFWGFEVLGWIFLGSIDTLTDKAPFSVRLILTFFVFIYEISVAVGIWRSADKYEGSDFLGVLSYTFVIIKLIVIGYFILSFISVLIT